MSRGKTAAAWWHHAIADRDSGAARGLAARLRRADGVAVLAEPAVQDLAARLGMTHLAAPDLIRLVQVLADLRTDDGATLARRLGEMTRAGRLDADPSKYSHLRFQRLIRAQDDEFTAGLRRAIIMADRRCDVARLAGDLMQWDHPDWGDGVRARWCFDYFGAFTAPQSSEETTA